MSETLTGTPVLQYRLGNGLRLVVKQDRRAPLVAYCLTFGVGSADETAGRTGFAHLFEHLMFQGSANVAPDEMAQTLTKLGGTPNAATTFDRTFYFCQLPHNAWKLALWFEADRLASMTSALDQRTLDRERSVVKNERRERLDNQPFGDSAELLYAATFPANHPYHIMPIGTMEDIDAANLDDVKAFFERHYGPNNAVLTVVGDVDPDDVVACVEEYFGPIPALASLPPRPHVALEPMTDVVRIVSQAPAPAPAAFTLYRGPAVDSVDYAALQVACHVLAGGATSRLTKAVTIDDDLCFEAVVNIEESYDGLSTVSPCGIVFPDREPEEFLQVLDEQIENLIQTPPTPQEMIAAQAIIVRELNETLDTFDSQAESISDSVLAFGHPNLVSERIARVKALTADDVARACARWLGQGRSEVIYPTGETR